MREALENSNGLLEELARIGEWGESARGQIAENKKALEVPLRNCDVGTAEEQDERFNKFCFSYYDINNSDCSCGKCPLRENNIKVTCEFAWSQMPYEKGVDDGSG